MKYVYFENPADEGFIKCEVCGEWFYPAGEETVCSDCADPWWNNVDD